MLHVLYAKNTTFHYNSDLSGVVYVYDHVTGNEIEISGKDVLELIDEYIRHVETKPDDKTAQFFRKKKQ